MPEGNMPSTRETLTRVFNNLVQLRVITAVGPVSVKINDADRSGTATSVNTGTEEIKDAFVTIFNLIDGDVTNVVPPSLREDAALRQFHAEQVEKSLTVLPQNIRVLIDFGKALINEITA